MKRSAFALFLLLLLVPAVRANEFSFPIGEQESLVWEAVDNPGILSFYTDMVYDKNMFVIDLIGPAGSFAAADAQFNAGTLNPANGVVTGITGNVTSPALPVDGLTFMFGFLFHSIAVGQGSFHMENSYYIGSDGVRHDFDLTEVANVTIYDPDAPVASAPELDSMTFALSGGLLLAALFWLRRMRAAAEI